MAFTILSDLSFVVTTCVTCGVKSALPEELDIQLHRSKDEHYCPNGHMQHYLGRTPEQERDDARMELHNVRDSNACLSNTNAAQAKRIKRLLAKIEDKS